MSDIVTYVNLGFADDFMPRWACLRFQLYDRLPLVLVFLPVAI